jgi:hypothetical protein
MESNERLGVAVVAAAVGAAVGAAVSRRGAGAAVVSRPPLELLPITETSSAASSRSATVREVPEDLDDRSAIVARPSAVEVLAANVPQLANTFSIMAVGALLTLLVLWSTGTFATFENTAATLPRVEGPATVADLPAEDEATPVEDRDATAEAEETEAAEAPAPPPRAQPVAIEIPAIGVDADVIELGLMDNGELEVPTEDFSQTGWWSGGVSPGDVGPAVIVGHVDSVSGPAVFFNLRELVFDDLIRVVRADGSAASYAVRSSIPVDKDEFPTDLVYGETDGAELRLITCDGDFSNGSYLGNLIITAELVREHPAPSSGTIS